MAVIDDLVLRENADLEVAHYARHYFANVTSLDQYVGIVLNELKSQGILDNTIVIFTSDHGEMLGSHGRTGKNVMENEAIAIPFIIHYPERLRPAVSTEILNVTDILPTVLGLAGLGELISEDIQGSDLSGSLLMDETGSGAQNAALLMLGSQRGLYTAEYTLCVAEDPGGDTISAAYMYDNLSDPYQLHRIDIRERPELARKMLIRLGQKLAESNDPWYKEQKYDDVIIYPYSEP